MSTGFTFGAKTTAAPSFGTGSITFGTPATQPQQQFGFGATSTPSLFGQTQQTAPSLSFKPSGFGAVTSSNPGFGLTSSTTTPGTGFAFGAPTASASTTGLTFGAPASTAPGTGFSFGAPPSSVPATGLSFGAPAATPATGLSFGATPSSTGLSFGGTSGGLSFGTAPASSGLNFGATPTSTPSLGLSFGAPAPTPSSGLTFATNTPSTGLNFGATTTGGLSFGLGGIAQTSLAPSLGLTATTAQQSVGLGGIATTQAKSGAAAQKEVPPKEQLLPNEFLQTVEQFKKVVQGQKVLSSEVARCSVKEFRKVETELDSLNQAFNQVETQLLNNRNLVEKLKFDTAKGLQNIEMAQRTQDTPLGLQFENTAPLQFFLDLAEQFDTEMQLLKTKIDNAEKYVKKYGEPSTVTSQDLALGMKRLHEIFVALAGRLHSIHNQVEIQKEQYLNLLRQTTNDTSNPFEKANRNTEAINTILNNVLKLNPPKITPGPTPFNNLSLGSNNLTLMQQNPTSSSVANNTFTTATFGQNNMFKGTAFGQSFGLNASGNFQLQKPPVGNKRGKQ